MQPNQTSTGYEPKWRQFHPQSMVWVSNPFDHDVVFQVADERNVPYKYKLGAHSPCELPGGAVATLGVKAIVDELIQNSKEDQLRMWDKDVRKKYEDSVILRVKEGKPMAEAAGPAGEIDLSVDDGKDNPVTEAPVEEVETAFPDLKTPEASQEVTNIANASLAGKQDAIIESD